MWDRMLQWAPWLQDHSSFIFIFFFRFGGGGGGIRDQVRPGINSCHTILDKKNGIVVMKDIPHYGHRD